MPTFKCPFHCWPFTPLMLKNARFKSHSWFPSFQHQVYTTAQLPGRNRHAGPGQPSTPSSCPAADTGRRRPPWPRRGHRSPAVRRRTPDGGGCLGPDADTALQLLGGGHQTDLADLLREPLVLVPDQPPWTSRTDAVSFRLSLSRAPPEETTLLPWGKPPPLRP